MESFCILIVVIVIQIYKYVKINRTEHQRKSVLVCDHLKNKTFIKPTHSDLTVLLQFIANLIFTYWVTSSFSQCCLHNWDVNCGGGTTDAEMRP